MPRDKGVLEAGTNRKQREKLSSAPVQVGKGYKNEVEVQHIFCLVLSSTSACSSRPSLRIFHYCHLKGASHSSYYFIYQPQSSGQHALGPSYNMHHLSRSLSRPHDFSV